MQRTYYSGGGGLCSTTADYYRFCQMLLDHGQAGKHRMLKAETVDLMTSPDHKTPGDNQEGNGFGLGFGVRRLPLDANKPQARGLYFWGGFFFTSFFVDPERELIAISMAQLHPAVNVDWGDKFTALVYASLTD